MPDWLTALFAALAGGLLSLAGVWVQLYNQQRQASEATRSSQAGVFARVLAIIEQYNPDRAERMLALQEPMPRGWDAEQVLAPVRDGLATYAAANPKSAPEVLELVRLIYAYFDALPGIDHWEGETAVVAVSTPEEERRRIYSRIGELVQEQLRHMGR